MACRFRPAPVRLLAKPWPSGASLLCILVLAAQPRDVRPQLVSHPPSLDAVRPANGAADVPLINFNILLTFSEVVQAGEGELLLSKEPDATPFYSAYPIERLSCQSSMVFVGRHVLLPIYRELIPGTYTVTVPNTCFKSSAGLPLPSPGPSWQFTTIPKGVTALGLDFTSPGWFSELAFPAPGSWADPTTQFLLYFDEAIWAGDAPVEVVRISPDGSRTVRSAIVSFPGTQGGTMGMLLVDAGRLDVGAEYELAFAPGSLRDMAGNFAGDSGVLFGSGGYRVKVSAGVVAYSPQQGATSVSRHSSIFLEFDSPVVRGSGSAQLCSGWRPGNPCSSSLTLGDEEIFVLGQRIIISPSSPLMPGQEYNFSISEGFVSYFQGLLPSSVTGAWDYSFTVAAPQVVTDSPPELITSRVDCSAAASSLRGLCREELGLGELGATPLPLGSKLKLYFTEPVSRVGGTSVTELRPVGDSPLVATSVAISAGSGAQSRVATLEPSLVPGQLYLLDLPSGVLLGPPPLQAAFPGTTVRVYRPLAAPQSMLHGAVDVARTATIDITFEQLPQLVAPTGTFTLEAAGGSEPKRVVSLADSSQVLVQNQTIFIMPRPALSAGVSYTLRLPVAAVQFMPVEFSMTFTTRAEDQRRPAVLRSSPSGLCSGLSLNSVAPSVLFSEGVAAVAGKHIFFRNGQLVQYAIAAADDACGTGGTAADACVVLDATRTKVSFYPLGKTANGSYAAPWASTGGVYEVEIEEGAFTDQLRPGSDKNGALAARFSFSVSPDDKGPVIVEGSPARNSLLLSSAVPIVDLMFDEPVYAGDNSVAIEAWDHVGDSPPSLLAGDELGPGWGGRAALRWSTLYWLVSHGLEAEAVQAGWSGWDAWRLRFGALEDAELRRNADAWAAWGAAQWGSSWWRVALSAGFNSSAVSAGALPSVNGRRQVVALTFDSAVTAGSGSHFFEILKLDSNELVSRVAAHEVVYVGNKALFSLQLGHSVSSSYYVRTSSAAAVVSRAGTAMAQPLDSRSAILPFVVENDQTPPRLLWSTADGFACLPASGILPDFVLFMSEDIQEFSRLRSIRLLHFDDSSSGSKELWNLVAGETPSSTGVNLTIDSTLRFKVTVGTGSLLAGTPGASGTPLSPGARYQLVIAHGLMTDFATPPVPSTQASVNFSLCQMQYDTKPSRSVRVYSPSPLAPLPNGGPRRFRVLLPRSSIRDVWGNLPVSDDSYEFGHETTPPSFNTQDSNPPNNGGLASARENIVLTFSEAVQAGRGVFQLCDGSTHEVSFEVDVGKLAAVSGGGLKVISGQHVSITPAFLCDSSLACGDLVPGRSYYVRTLSLGVLRDAVGNRLPALDSSSSWRFQVSSEDRRRPDLAFLAGHSVLPAQGLDPPMLVGNLFFTELVVPNLLHISGTVSLYDCGPDLDCEATEDNVQAPLVGKLSFANRTTGKYGLVTFSCFLTQTLRRYQLVVPSNLVADVALGTGLANIGPQNTYSFVLDVGNVMADATDTTAPYLIQLRPSDTLLGASVTDNLVLDFSENVQLGSGSVQLCKNWNAVADGAPACIPGLLADGSPAVLDVSAAILKSNRLTFDWPQDLQHLQRLHVVLPEGLVRDLAGNPSVKVEKDMYSFSTTEWDDVQPILDYFALPATSSAVVTLHFSEAVVLSRGVIVKELPSKKVVQGVQTEVAGNSVTLRYAWRAAGNYSLEVVQQFVQDRAGNTLQAGLNATFAISADITAPNATVQPADGAADVRKHDILVVEFNEPVAPALGATLPVTLRSAGCSSPAGNCGAQGPIMEVLVSSIPLVNYVSATGHQVSAAFLEPPDPLQAGEDYTLLLPPSSFSDLAGNAFPGLESRFKVDVSKDHVRPRLLAVDLGGSPNPCFSGLQITLYFSEAIELTAESAVQLLPSDGGNRCDGGSAPGSCSTAPCNSPCGYGRGAATVTLQLLKANGARVVAKLPTTSPGQLALEPGLGYSVVVAAGAVRDMAGNPCDAFDGLGYQAFVFQVSSALSDVTAPSHALLAPNQLDTWPLNGSQHVPQSTSLRITFAEAVQAGAGSIFVGDVAIPVEDCLFSGQRMICDPPGDLAPGKDYFVKYAAGVVKDLAGNSLKTGLGSNGMTLSFRTISLDFKNPTLLPTSVANVSLKNNNNNVTPFDPPDGSVGVAPSQVLAITFSESVQAGTGQLLIQDCTGGEPHLCYDGVEELVPDSTLLAIDMRNEGSSGSEVLFSGPTMLVSHPSLTLGARYTVKTSQPGALMDLAGQPLAQIKSGFEFTVVSDDLQPPRAVAFVPVPGSTAPGGSDITLYFSEAVQAVAGSDKVITVTSANGAEITQATAYNRVGISGSVVTVARMREAEGEVTVSIAAGSFADLVGNAFPGLSGSSSYRWTASKSSAQILEPATPQTPFPPSREGAVLQYLETLQSLLYYGGRSTGKCHSDGYVSADAGATWKHHVGGSGPAVAWPATAANAFGCAFLLGGQCDGNGTSTLWRTCSAGASWMPMPSPRSLVTGVAWPTSLVGHAMVIVGGWQLVVVDAVRGHVWAFEDRNMTSVVRTADHLPFARRWAPTLLASSDGQLFLLGGRACEGGGGSGGSLCDGSGQMGPPLTDIWKSPYDPLLPGGGGWTWVTANWAAAVASTSAPDIAALTSEVPAAVALARDDTLHLVARQGGMVFVGQLPSSDSPAMDTTFAATPQLRQPGAGAVVPAPESVDLHFSEAIRLRNPRGVRLMDLITGAVVPFTPTVQRQVLRVERQQAAHLLAGRQYRLELADGSIEDMAGNQLRSFAASNFTVEQDTSGPSLLAVYPADEAVVAPQTVIMLTFDEDVVNGDGFLELKGSGEPLLLRAREASVVGSQAHFELPKGLAAGQRYTVTVPEDLFLDRSRNRLRVPSIGPSSSFTVLASGTSDATPPVLMMSSPEDGSTGVSGGLRLLKLWFSEDIFIARAEDGNTDAILERPVTAGLSIKLPLVSSSVASTHGSVLELSLPSDAMGTAGTYRLRVPAGALVDGAGNGLAANLFMTFNADAPDVDPPSLLSLLPDFEPSPVYQQPPSTTLVLTFSEPVHASGRGQVRLVPLGLGRAVSLEVATSPHITLAGNQMIVAPPVDLTPGEAYSIELDQGLVQDARGNLFGGSTAATLRISIAPMLQLRELSQRASLDLGGTGRGSEPTSGSPTLSSALSAAFDAANRLILIGSSSGTADGVSPAVAWRLDTKRGTHCASALEESPKCSQTSCSGSSPPTLGSFAAQRRVWRSSSNGGRSCMNEEGAPVDRVGEAVGSLSGSCPCPQCFVLPPGPVSQNASVDAGNFSAVSAAEGVWPLTCTQGFAPTGPFVCQTDEIFGGAWRQPYPVCKPQPCTEPPRMVPYQDLSTAGTESECGNVSHRSPLAHGATCTMRCQAGYMPHGTGLGQGRFVCQGYGKYDVQACIPQVCQELPDAQPNAIIHCPSDRLGSECQVLCDPGFEIVGNSTIRCEVTSAMPEAVPAFTAPGRCRPRSCGTLNLTDPLGQTLVSNGTSADADADVAGDEVGSSRDVRCADGYVPSEQSLSTFTCRTTSSNPGSSVAWSGVLSCVPRSCSTPEKQFPNGRPECSGTPRYGDSCSLVCAFGFSLSGGGKLVCGEDGRLGSSSSCVPLACPVPALVPHAMSHICPTPLPHGTSCSVQCVAGFVASGSYSCSFGGLSSVPICTALGEEPPQKVPAVGSTMFIQIASLPPGMASAGDLAADAAFQEHCREGLTDALTRGGEPANITVDSVVATSRSESSAARRLQTTSGPSLQLLRVNFRATAGGSKQKILELLGAAQQADTKAIFATSLQALVSGLQLAAMDFTEPWSATMTWTSTSSRAPSTSTKAPGGKSQPLASSPEESLASMDSLLAALAGLLLSVLCTLSCVCGGRIRRCCSCKGQNRLETKGLAELQDSLPSETETEMDGGGIDRDTVSVDSVSVDSVRVDGVSLQVVSSEG